MVNEMERQFPWIPMIKRGFLKSFSSDYEIETLELLQQNIEEEILKVKNKFNLERGKLLFGCIKYFYYHFCRKWYQGRKFSHHMEDCWVHIVSSFIKISIFLSRGKKSSKWINKVLDLLMRFPGEKNLMYDALLSVSSLNKRYHSAFGSILMHLLVRLSLFVPMVINHPVHYLKLCLLFRRLKFLVEDPAEKIELQMKASKIRAPSNLTDWLATYHFNANWVNRTFKIHLGINIFRKLKGKQCEMEVVETLRKILLPKICTDRIKIDIKNKKKKNERSHVNDQLALMNDDAEKIDLNEMECKSKNMKKRKNLVEYPLLSEEIGDDKEQEEINKSKEKRKKTPMHIDDSAVESNRKKRIETVVIDEIYPDLVYEASDDQSILENVQKTSKTTRKRKRRTKKSKRNELEDLPIIVDEINASKPGSDRKKSQSRFELENISSCSDDDEPLIVTEIKHYSKFGLSSCRRKSKSNKNELSPCDKAKTSSESLFTIDSEPSLCITESSSTRIAYNTIYDSQQKAVLLSKESGNISNDKERSTSSVNLSDLDDERLLSETKPVKKIVDILNAIKETKNSCHLKNAKSSNSQIFSDASKSNLNDKVLLSEKEINISSDNLADINENSQNHKQDDISLEREEHSSHINQIDEESSRDSAVQTEDLDYSSNQTSVFVEKCINCRIVKADSTPEKCGTERIESPIQSDNKERTESIDISKEDIPILEYSKSFMSNCPSINESGAQEIEMQKDSCTLIETDELVSNTDSINIADANFISTEITADNSEDIKRKRDMNEIVQEKKGSDSSSNISGLKIGCSSLQSLTTISSKSVTDSGRNSLDAVQHNNIELEMNVPMENSGSSENEGLVESMDYSLNTNTLSLKSGLSRKVDSDSNSSLEIDNLKDLNGNVDANIRNPTQNDSVHELPPYQASGPFCDVKSLVTKTEIDASETPRRSGDHKIFDKNHVAKDNTDAESKSHEITSPNSSAAQGLMKNMLNLVELASCVKDESAKQSVLRGDISSTVYNLPLEFLSRVTSSNNEGPISFLDVSGESESNPNEIQISKSSEFLQYRDFSDDQDDNRSEDAFSESKSIVKTEASEYSSDATSNNTEDEENSSASDSNSHVLSSDSVPEASNFKNNFDTYVIKTEFSYENNIERQRFYGDNDNVSETTQSSEIKIEKSTKNRTPQKLMLNPVVNLGERCDSKTFILSDSSVSENAYLPPDVKPEPFECNQIPSTISQSPSPTHKVALKQEVIEDSPSNSCDEISGMKSVVKIENGSKQEGVEICLTAGQAITVSGNSSESAELKIEKEISLNREVSGHDNDLESVESTSKDVSENQGGTKSGVDHKLSEDRKEVEAPRSMRLRKRPVSVVETQQSVVSNADSCIENQNSSSTSGRSLRSRKTQEVKNDKSQTTTKRSSKRLKKEVNTNFGFDFSVLSLNSPKAARSKPNNSSNNSNNLEVVREDVEPPTSTQEKPPRRLTRSATNSSKVDAQDIDPEGYRLRSRKTIIMPGRLKL